jgi:hypothetical protein
VWVRNVLSEMKRWRAISGPVSSLASSPSTSSSRALRGSGSVTAARVPLASSAAGVSGCGPSWLDSHDRPAPRAALTEDARLVDRLAENALRVYP